MSKAATGVVVTHGDLGEGIVDAVRTIAGATPGALVAISNRGKSRDALCDEIRHAAGNGPSVVFADLPSGSCHLAAATVAREDPNMVVLTGVNLPMVLDFVFHRRLGGDELVNRLTEKGREAIHGYRPAEGR